MVLQVRGPLTIGEREFGIRRAVRTVLDSGTRAFVVDLDGLTLIDSSGVAEIATTHTTVANRGGRLVLCNVSEKLRDVFVITRLNTVFETHATEAEALAALAVQT
jgi:anti-sigma B factor antagonist